MNHCFNCLGSGKVEDKPCKHCGGTGKEPTAVPETKKPGKKE